MKKQVLIGLAAVAFLAGCKDDKNNGGAGNTSNRSVVIANEGAFPNGISSISVYDPTNQTVENNVYRKTNINALGSVVRDVLVDGNRTFFISNADEELIVAKGNDFKLEKRVKADGSNLRHIIKVGMQKYYVTNWTMDEVKIFNGNNLKFAGSIETGTDPGRMIQYEDLVFVVNNGGPNIVDSTVTVIRSTADTVVTTLEVGQKPNSLAIDGNNYLWVLSGGVTDFQNPTMSTVGSLHRYQLDSMITAIDSNETIMKDTAMDFTDNQLKPYNLQVNAADGQLFYLGNESGDIIRMNTMAKSVSETPFVEGSFYRIAFDKEETELYATDALDFESNGQVVRISPIGNVKDQFTTDIIPGDIEFRE